MRPAVFTGSPQRSYKNLLLPMTPATTVPELIPMRIDIGVPVLSMHSPFEVVSKADVYMAYLAFKSFCEDAE